MYREILVIFSTICLGVYGQDGLPEVDENVCVGQEDGLFFGIEGYCTQYYYCEGEYGYLEDCTAFGDFQFDPAIQQCNYREEVNCVEYGDYTYPDPDPDTEPPIIVQTTAAPPTIQTPPSDPNLLPDVECPTNRPNEILFFESTNCTEYYICANGVKLTMKCSDGFVFNIEEKQCDHPVYNPRCSNISFDPQKNVRCNRHGFYTAAYPLDCTKYVFCAEGIPMVQACPIGTAWHIDRCVAKQYAQCFNTQRF